MNKIITSMAVVSLLSVSALAQDTNTQKKSEIKNTQNESVTTAPAIKAPVSELKSFDISAGYTITELKTDDNDKIDAKGVNISLGKIFNLNNEISTTTSLVGNLTSLDKKDMDIENGSVRMNDVGISQRFTYSFASGDATVKPFVELGVSTGKMNFESSYVEDGDSFNIDGSIKYNKFGGAVGMQLALSNGITPFVKYNISKVKMDNKVKYEASYNGQSVSGSETNEGSSKERTLDSTSLIIGLGYLF